MEIESASHLLSVTCDVSWVTHSPPHIHHPTTTMNIEYLRESLQLVSYAGAHLLNNEQLALLEHSLLVLQNDNLLPQIFFWGRVSAVNGDYYIAFGYLKDALRGRRFFFSKNCVQWFLLPPAKKIDNAVSALIVQPFSGDVSHIDEVLLDPEFVIDPSGSVLRSEPQRWSMNEEERLAAVVTQITDEAALLPRGALVKKTDGRTVYAPTFRGLGQLEASQLENYALYREPQDEWNANLLKRPDYNYSTDIFDTIDSLVPANRTFALSVDAAAAGRGGLVVIRSLYWPGMAFFHKGGSRKHGFGYFGDGRKNMDLLFML